MQAEQEGEKANSRIVELESILDEANQHSDLETRNKELEAENEELQKQVKMPCVALFRIAGAK